MCECQSATRNWVCLCFGCLFYVFAMGFAVVCFLYIVWSLACFARSLAFFLSHPRSPAACSAPFSSLARLLTHALSCHAPFPTFCHVTSLRSRSMQPLLVNKSTDDHNHEYNFYHNVFQFLFLSPSGNISASRARSLSPVRSFSRSVLFLSSLFLPLQSLLGRVPFTVFLCGVAPTPVLPSRGCARFFPFSLFLSPFAIYPSRRQ